MTTSMQRELRSIDAEERVLIAEHRLALASGNRELAARIKEAMDSRRQQFAARWLNAEIADDLPTPDAVNRRIEALRGLLLIVVCIFGTVLAVGVL